MNRLTYYVREALKQGSACKTEPEGRDRGIRFAEEVKGEAEAWESETGQHHSAHRVDLQMAFSEAFEDAPLGTPLAAFLDGARSRFAAWKS